MTGDLLRLNKFSQKQRKLCECINNRELSYKGKQVVRAPRLRQYQVRSALAAMQSCVTDIT